jgi:hypothetical protein
MITHRNAKPRRLNAYFQKTLEICYWIPEIDAAVQQTERARRAK